MNEEINNTLSILNQGGTILYPTDTVWGIGCDATDAEAVAKIYKLKQRDDAKSLIILLADAAHISQYVAEVPTNIISIIEKFDHPTTVIYSKAKGLPANLINSDGSIAIRITKDPFCVALIQKLKKPLVSTSANISGQPTAKFFNDIDFQIKNGVDYIVKHRQNDNQYTAPSSILKIDPISGEITYIRK